MLQEVDGKALVRLSALRRLAPTPLARLQRVENAVIIARSAIACLLLVLATGCSRSATVQMRGVAPLHVNDAGESTPVKVRIYQLTRGDRFAAATVEQLWTDAAATLGDELAGDPVEVSVLPGNAGAEPMRVDLAKLPQGVSAIGVLGLFRRPDAQDQRKLVVPVEDAGANVIELTGYGVRAVPR